MGDGEEAGGEWRRCMRWSEQQCMPGRVVQLHGHGAGCGSANHCRWCGQTPEAAAAGCVGEAHTSLVGTGRSEGGGGTNLEHWGD